jgi:hypothetical protein
MTQAILCPAAKVLFSISFFRTGFPSIVASPHSRGGYTLRKATFLIALDLPIAAVFPRQQVSSLSSGFPMNRSGPLSELLENQ